MNRLAKRKTKLALLTDATVYDRGRKRNVIIEPGPELATIRLAGTRTRLEVSWNSIYNLAARIAAERAVEDRRANRRRAR